MATHSSILAWRIPMDGGAWWAAFYGIAQSQTQLKQLSSSNLETAVVVFLKFTCNWASSIISGNCNWGPTK